MTNINTFQGQVGVGTVTPTGQLEVHGSGQSAITTFNQAGNMGGCLALRDDDNNVGSGGAVMFGAHTGFHAAIKSSLEDGSNNTRGHLSFFVRAAHGDSTMAHVMTLADGGSVGIGTTNPAVKLQVGANNETAPQYLWIRGNRINEAGDISGIHFYNSVNSGDRGNSRIINSRGTDNYASSLQFWTNPAGNTPATQKMVIDQVGNVGVGTATPRAKLHINSSSGGDGIGIFNPNNGTGGQLAFGSGVRGGILISNGGGGSNASDAYSSQPLVMNGGGTGATDGHLRGGSIWSAWGGAQYGIAIRGANSGAAVPHGASDPGLFITDNTVGIGLNGPSSKLSIVGNYSNSQAPTTYNSAPSLNVVFNSGADFVPICQFRSNTGITNVQENGIFHKRGNGHTMGLKTSSGHVLFRNETTQKQMQLHTNGTLYINCNARAPSFTNESDDRIKYNESGVKNAIQTLFKLKPQTYEKGKMEIDILEHQEYINTANKEGYEWNNIEDAWIKRQTDLTVKREAGLMAQDIWYDAPELRHMVVLPEDATPDDTKPSEPEPGNIRVDPDYDSAGWGKLASAGVDYNSLIPYLIKSIKELYYEVPRYKTSVSTEIYSNVQDYHNMIVCRSGENIQFTNTGNDKTVHGVISDIKTDTDNYELLIEHSGLGNAWVINTGSTINAGDYITTSNVTGYGMLQDSAFCMNYTLAKSTIECDFTLQTTPIKQKIRRLQDKTYWIKTEALLDCSLMAYSNLSNDIRTTQMETYYDVYENKNTSSNVVEQHTRQYTIDNEVPTQLTESEMNWGHFSNTFAFNTPFNTGAQTRIKYLRKQISKIGNEIGGYEPIVEQELMDVLDENGQVQWEDTGETRALHELRYLTVDGSITDQSNAVYTSSLLPVVLLL